MRWKYEVLIYALSFYGTCSQASAEVDALAKYISIRAQRY